jgi:F-type H+-transporting ATPase subunit gamma
MSRLYSPELAERFPLLRQPTQTRRAAVLLITANRGLSGAFNANLIRESRNLIGQLEREGVEVELHAVGRKGLGYYRYIGRTIASSRTDIGDRPTAQNAAELVDDLMAGFANGRLDAVYIIHAHFKSAISTPPITVKILPVTPPESSEGTQHDYLLFPSAEEILSSLLPAYVRNMVYRALVENTAAFYSAQRTAMKNATDNASDMLNILRRTYNRSRQANITQEIAEIVGGAAAL